MKNEFRFVAREKWKKEFRSLHNFGSCDSSASLLLDMEVKVMSSCSFSAIENCQNKNLTEICCDFKKLSSYSERKKYNKIEIHNNYICEKPSRIKSSHTCIDGNENLESNIPTLISSIHDYCTRETCRGMK